VTNVPATVADFLAAFRSRHALCAALVELSEVQQALVAAEDYAALVELLSHKQRLIDSLLDSGRESPPLWQQWRAERDRLPSDLRHECTTILDEADRLLNQVLTLESESTQHMQQHRDVTERRLRDVNHGSQALAAYDVPSEPSRSRRLDLDL
jgi:hypothetical protein